MASINAVAIDELREQEEVRRAALPYINGGQMADSYDTLHGVRFVTLILQSIPAELTDGSLLHYTLYLHDLFLIESVVQLMHRAKASLECGAPNAAADHLTWASRLLQHKQDGDGLLPAHAHPTSSEPAIESLRQALDALSSALLDELDHLAQLAVLGSPVDPHARLVHLTKIMILQVKETALCARTPPDDMPTEVVDAHRRCVVAASEGLKLDGDSYLNQFCLLHQLPELLAPLTLGYFDVTQNALVRNDLAAAAVAARVSGDVLQLIVSSLWPLIELLYPAQYYAFRENLGATSGSSSIAIRSKLLTTAYVKLGKAVSEWMGNGMRGTEADLFLVQLSRVRALIYRWRGLHMALPRNVLGSNGTKSLMGSPDALKAVETMAESFQAKDPLAGLLGGYFEESFAADSATAKLDRRLLAATGEAAQLRFREVQERTGAWRRVRNAPKRVMVND